MRDSGHVKLARRGVREAGREPRTARCIRPAALLALACCLLPLAAGCRHPNARRHRDDVKIKVKLTREFVRDRMEDVPKETHNSDKLIEDAFDDVHNPRDFLRAVFILVVVAPFFCSAEEVVLHAETTKGYIRPKDRYEYQQRLYWGDNKVYLPADCAGKVVPLTVEFFGNYAGTYELEVDLSKRGRKVRL
jgi:hypothetical protein